MNLDQFEGKWEQLKGQVKQKWGKFTDDDITVIKGKKDEMIGKLKERYGYDKEQAEKELSSFISACGCSSDEKKADNTGCCN